jgi:hypothetical protein
LQAFLDKHLKSNDPVRGDLRVFAEEASLFARMAEADQLASRFLDQAVAGLRAGSGALSVPVNGGWRTVRTAGTWTGRADLSVPILHNEKQVAVLLLGPRGDGREYTQEESEALAGIAGDVGRALVRGAPTG